MINYSKELLFQKLSSEQINMAGVSSREEWWYNMFEGAIMPAITGIQKTKDQVQDNLNVIQLNEEEKLAKSKINQFGQILPIEDIEKVIDLTSSITRMPCGCRFKTTGKTDKRYCFGLGFDELGIMGKYPDAASSLEILDKEDTKRIMRKFDEEGLIHSIWTAITPYVGLICNCDYDCLMYKSNIDKGSSTSIFRGEYVCQINIEGCTGCKSCMSQCQFGAQFYSHGLSTVYIDPSRCYGCGVCRAACPNDAIELLPREQVPEASDIWYPMKK